MITLIKGGRVIDPGNNIDKKADIYISDDKIFEITEPGKGSHTPEKTIDAAGKIVAPGLIDMHVHLRDPGYEYKETIETGCKAAAAGGFTAICCMPNTKPVNDNRQITEYIIKNAKSLNSVKVYPIAAISVGLNGEQLCEYHELKQAGAVGISDDGKPVSNSQLMRRVLEYSNVAQIPVISHCEDLDLVEGGVMNEGALSTAMGLKGIPNAAESTMVMRDIYLSEFTDTPVHIAHVSTAESVDLIRIAKAKGIKVTAETAPHYFTLTEDAVKGYNTYAKMNPPLRAEKDRDAIRKGLADGTINVIATDHAPHSQIEKDVEFDLADFGIIGLETSLPLSLKLVEDEVISIQTLIEKMSTNPAKILNLQSGIKPGNSADLTIIDTEYEHTINSKKFKSKSLNTPFNGYKLTGKAVFTIINGNIVFKD